MSGSFSRVWGIPILLAVFSGVGLISALLDDGIWDALSWLTLGVVVVVMGWYWIKPARR